jgi:hypothetical protein
MLLKKTSPMCLFYCGGGEFLIPCIYKNHLTEICKKKRCLAMGPIFIRNFTIIQEDGVQILLSGVLVFHGMTNMPANIIFFFMSYHFTNSSLITT